MKPDETKTKACLKDVKAWMTNIFLLLNTEKTKIMIVGPKPGVSNSNDLGADERPVWSLGGLIV